MIMMKKKLSLMVTLLLMLTLFPYAVHGEDNVFDFSGINSISEEKSNFYDPLHFKVYVGKQLLDEAYGLPHTIN